MTGVEEEIHCLDICDLSARFPTETEILLKIVDEIVKLIVVRNIIII